MTDERPILSKEVRLPQLSSVQILRAVAAFSVVLFHLGGNVAREFGLTTGNPFPIGYLGVDLFFVISGFIICYSTEKDKRVGVFIVKRATRLVPLYWILTLGVFTIALYMPTLLNQTKADTIGLIKSLLFIPYKMPSGSVVPTLALGWTLNYEVFFYALFAISLSIGRNRIGVCITILLATAFFGAIYQGGNTAISFWTSPIIVEFIFGCLVFLLYKHYPSVIKRARLLWLPAAVIFLGQLFIDVPLDRVFKGGLPAALLLTSLLSWDPVKSKLNRFLLELGNASYSMYLIHFYVIQFFTKIVAKHLSGVVLKVVVAYGLSIAVTIIASICLFRLFEEPVNKALKGLLLGGRPQSSSNKELSRELA